jgi:hypothetical protein
MFVFGLKVAWRLVRQKLLLDALSQTITRDEAVETGFLPQSIFQVCRLQEQLLLWLIQQTGEVPVGPFNPDTPPSGMSSRTCSRGLSYNHA